MYISGFIKSDMFMIILVFLLLFFTAMNNVVGNIYAL